jgi:hypothetical protein
VRRPDRVTQTLDLQMVVLLLGIALFCFACLPGLAS